IIKVLTLLTALTTPTLLIGTWYGMNLKMPEYQWENAYPFFIGLDLVATILIVAWLRWKHWL
ncbi:MAG TPA: CorA family divalent cation transporter, partial [Candidatus Methylacidiphilales bacterium]|nr:CorA family divalent cation transporter [Candidatus Methylacidiphilales bacterium]